MIPKEKGQATHSLCISVPEAAKLLDISRNTGYKMARLGQLPTIKCGQRRLVVAKASLMKILQEGNERHEKRKE